MIRSCALFAFFILHANCWAFLGSGLEVSLAGDMIFDQGLNDTSTAEEKLTMRGAEMMFFAPIDQRFEGTLSAAAHDESGETVFELHELFVSSSKLIPRTRLKLGQFFLGVGRLNRIHQHDWPFIRAPKVHETFFDTEGVFDSGAELGYLLPTDMYLDLTVGVTSGYRYGHAHTAGSKPKTPTHYLRLATFKEFSTTDGAELAFNYLGRTDEQDNKAQILGGELTAKWRQGRKILYLFQSELWYRNTQNGTNASSEQAGFYIFNQYGFTDNWSLGFRFDGFKDLTKTNPITGLKINNVEYNLAPEITWRSSEFFVMRGGLSYSFLREEGETLTTDLRAEVQMVFILGAHPAHSF